MSTYPHVRASGAAGVGPEPDRGLANWQLVGHGAGGLTADASSSRHARPVSSPLSRSPPDDNTRRIGQPPRERGGFGDDRHGGLSAVRGARCAVCGSASARVELIAPGGRPAGWDQWSHDRKDAWTDRRDPEQWYLLFEGVAAGNGGGDPISADRARQIADGFAEPLSWAQVQASGFYDDAGFCRQCDAPYCYRHWHVTRSGYGYCPEGHGKSLDPH